MKRNDNGPFPASRPVPIGWCDSGGQGLGWGSSEKVGDKTPCPVCEKTVTVVARFGDYGYPSYARHKLPKTPKE